MAKRRRRRGRSMFAATRSTGVKHRRFGGRLRSAMGLFILTVGGLHITFHDVAVASREFLFDGIVGRIATAIT